MAVIVMINAQRQRVKRYIENDPHYLNEMTRRLTKARAILESIKIAGYQATMEDALAAIDGDDPMDAREEGWQEVLGYSKALTYIQQLAEDGCCDFHPQLFRSLHFMMSHHSPDRMPGRWRLGKIRIANPTTADRVYVSPDFEQVPALIDELVHDLNASSDHSITDRPIIVKAAMAHLNLIMIRPFKDANGRVARAVHRMLLSQEGGVNLLFSSIEEWLGKNRQAYHKILEMTGQPSGSRGSEGRFSWNPANDTHPWIRFCLRGHYQQALLAVQRHEWYRQLYEEVRKIQSDHKLQDRTYFPMMDAALGFRVRAGGYRKASGISEVVTSRDLKKMSDLGIITPHGERRGRFYTGSKALVETAAQLERAGAGAEGGRADPYEMVCRQQGPN